MKYLCWQHILKQKKKLVYKTLYGDRNIWVRPYAMFIEKVIVADRKKPRFEKINDGK